MRMPIYREAIRELAEAVRSRRLWAGELHGEVRRIARTFRVRPRDVRADLKAQLARMAKGPQPKRKAPGDGPCKPE